MWTWPSTAPGMTSIPVASTTRRPSSAAPTAAIRPSTTPTSAHSSRSRPTTRPPRTTRSNGGAGTGSGEAGRHRHRPLDGVRDRRQLERVLHEPLELVPRRGAAQVDGDLHGPEAGTPLLQPVGRRQVDDALHLDVEVVDLDAARRCAAREPDDQALTHCRQEHVL